MSEHDNAQSTVLVVEDNPGALKLFRLALEADGYRVLEAQDGKAAIEHLTREPVGLVLQDFVLPDMEGSELLQQLRALPYGRDLPVVVVSGFKSMLSPLHCGAGGFSAALLKPVQPSALLQTVRKYLPSPECQETASSKQATILVVDDDPVQLKLSRLRLEHAGFAVTTAADGETALRAAVAQVPDAVLCDVLMPGMDGYELCVKLRNTLELRHVPVVLASAYYGGRRDEELAFSVGAAELVVRTPELEAVIASLRRVVARANAVVAPFHQLPEREHQNRVTAQLVRQARANTGLTEKAALQAAQLAILAGIAEALLRSETIETALEDVLITCLDAGGISRGAQYKVSSDERLVLTHSIGFPAAAACAVQDAFGCSEKLVQATHHPVLSVRSCMPSCEAQELLRVSDVAEAVFIPLLEGSRCVGALLLGSNSKEMSERDLLSFGRAIAAQIAQASALGEAFTRLREGEKAGRVLAASLDLEQVLTSFGLLATERLADVCELRLGQGEPRVYTREGVDALGAQSAPPAAEGTLETEILLPLEAHGATLGTVTFSRARSGRRFSPSDRSSIEDLVGRAAIAIDNAQLYKAANDASRLKDEFLATVSHELRTPLNAILGWARMLTSGLAVSKHAQAFRVIERNALAQTRLIDDLLDTSRIISGKMRLELRLTQLPRVIDAALESARPAIELKKIVLRNEVPARASPVMADPDRLQQIVWNLLSNAIRFTPEGGCIEVSVVESDAHLLLSVADNGQGVESTFLGSVFDRFRQADGAITRAHGGLGLGLAITRHLVELHGGTITAHSEGKGCGSLFTVLLPLASAEAVEGKKSFPPPHALPHVTLEHELGDLSVLVVDDDADARELISATLEECGAHVTGAASAAEAMTSVALHRPDILLSDIGMPGEDGFSLIRRLRALPSDQGGLIPAAAITAYARDEDRAQTLQAGYQLHVAKPIDPSELIATVSTLRKMSQSVTRSR